MTRMKYGKHSLFCVQRSHPNIFSRLKAKSYFRLGIKNVIQIKTVKLSIGSQTTRSVKNIKYNAFLNLYLTFTTVLLLQETDIAQCSMHFQLRFSFCDWFE